MQGNVEAETNCDTVAEENPETLVNSLADRLPHVVTETEYDTLAEVKTAALVDALADTIPELETQQT